MDWLRRSIPVRRLGVGVLLLTVSTLAAAAAPVITEVGFRRPARTAIGEVLVLWAQPLSTSVEVYFSDGSAPTVAATPSWIDASRGMLAVRVPEAARAGMMKISVDGVDSSPFFLRVKATPFTPGADIVSGQVTSGGAPLPHTAVVLLRDTGCNGNVEMWDVAESDDAGDYVLHGQDGGYMLLAWPPPSAGVAGGATFVRLSSTPATHNFELVAGTTVTGSVVDSGTSATPIAGARLAFDGQGHDEVVSDASGEFTIHLPPGEWDLQVTPPPGDRHAHRREAVAIDETSPQSLPLQLNGGGVISGTVSRLSDGRPLPGAELYAQVFGAWSGETDRKMSGGGGGYTLVVPPNQSYNVYYRFDRDSSVSDGSQPVDLEGSDITLNFASADCAGISGVVTDRTNSQPVAGVSVQAMRDLQPGTETETCNNGSYRLRVPPGPPGFVVGVWPWTDNGYAAQAWNNTPGGTPFACEGTSIAPASPADSVNNVNFSLVQGVALSGRVYTQASGCLETVPNQWVTIDDGAPHDCSLGIWSNSGGELGSYHIYGLPPSSVVASLRACVYPFFLAGQCYALHAPPAYTPVAIAAGGEASGIDFCVGDTPTTEVTDVRVQRAGEMIVLSWAPTSDPYHFSYTVRGGGSATPASPPGSFPTDPSMTVVYTTQDCSVSLPANAPVGFFLVTSTGATGIEGPSGSYQSGGSGPE